MSSIDMPSDESGDASVLVRGIIHEDLCPVLASLTLLQSMPQTGEWISQVADVPKVDADARVPVKVRNRRGRPYLKTNGRPAAVPDELPATYDNRGW